MNSHTDSHARRRLGGLAAAIALAALIATPAGAQMELTFVGVGETAGDDVSLLLGQVSAHRAGLGLMPVFSLQAYTVVIDGGDNTWAVSPGVGLRYRADAGALQAKVGYSIRPDEDEGPAFPFFGGAEGGVTTSLHADYWDRGAYGLQGLASYNWGSEYLWSRARGTLRLAELGAGSSIHGGVEGVWQGELRELETGLVGGFADSRYRAVQVGPILQWNSANVIGILGGGWKKNEFDFGDDGAFVDQEADDSTWYFKVELVFTPR